jgi:hypothetical protein
MEPFGLEKLVVTDLRMYGNTLYAGTEGAGVFRRDLTDTVWTLVGLEGKTIRSVYPHQVGPIGFAITVGVKPDQSSGDSALVYCWIAQQWSRTDTGMDHTKVWEIRSVDGIPTPQVCGETFAVGSGNVFVRKNVLWESTLQGMVLNVVRVSPQYSVWIGGETLIFSPYIAKSGDLGQTWTPMFPDLAGDNACNSIACHPADSNVVYAGMEGTVIKTTDGGIAWRRTGLTNTPFYFSGLAIDPLNPQHLYAGGTATPDSFGLFESIDGGESWWNVQPPSGTRGLSSIVADRSRGNEVYVATRGSGVLRYHSQVDAAAPREDAAFRFGLDQCYPNPFNSSTVVRYHIGSAASVTLKVYDLLGREIAALVHEVKPPGEYAANWNAEGVASGIYLVRLQAGASVDVKKWILVK